MTITPTTKLEAVNTLLRAIGESPVSSLAGQSGVDVVTAVATLDAVMKAVQSRGWTFNTEYGYPLTRDADGKIIVPANALSVDIDHRAYPNIDPVLRGNRVYDRMNHTYTFDRDLEARIIFGFEFNQMPEVAREYVTQRAGRRFQGDSVGSEELFRFHQVDEAAALLRLQEEQAEDEDLNFIADSPELSMIWRV